MTDRNFRKVREGIVISDKMDKTVVVKIEERAAHGLYSKVITKNKKFKAHDETNSAGVGDRVRIMETRPLSATKRWRVVEITENTDTEKLASFSVSVFSVAHNVDTQVLAMSSSAPSRMQFLVDK